MAAISALEQKYKDTGFYAKDGSLLNNPNKGDVVYSIDNIKAAKEVIAMATKPDGVLSDQFGQGIEQEAQRHLLNGSPHHTDLHTGTKVNPHFKPGSAPDLGSAGDSDSGISSSTPIGDSRQPLTPTPRSYKLGPDTSQSADRPRFSTPRTNPSRGGIAATPADHFDGTDIQQPGNIDDPSKDIIDVDPGTDKDIIDLPPTIPVNPDSSKDIIDIPSKAA